MLFLWVIFLSFFFWGNFRKEKIKDKASNVLIIYILGNIRPHSCSKNISWKVYAKGLMLLTGFPERTNECTNFASDCCFVKFLLQFYTPMVKSSKASLSWQTDFQRNSTFTGAPKEASRFSEVLSILCTLRGRPSVRSWSECTQQTRWFITILVSPWTITRKRKTDRAKWKKKEVKLLLLDAALLVTEYVLFRENCGRLLCFPSNIFEYILNVKTDLYFWHFPLPW